MTVKTTAYRIRIGNSLDMTVPAARLSSVVNSVLHSAGGLLSIDIISAYTLSRSVDMIASIVDSDQMEDELSRRNGYGSYHSKTGKSARRLIQSIKQTANMRTGEAPVDYAILTKNNARRMAIAKIARKLLEQQENADNIPEIKFPENDDMLYKTIALDSNGVAELAAIISDEISEQVDIKAIKGKYRIRQWIYEQSAIVRPVLTPLKVIVTIAMIAMLLTGNIITAALDGCVLLFLCLLHSLSLDYSFAGMTIYGTLQDDAGTQDYSAYYKRQQILETGAILLVSLILCVISIVIIADITSSGGMIDQMAASIGVNGANSGTSGIFDDIESNAW